MKERRLSVKVLYKQIYGYEPSEGLEKAVVDYRRRLPYYLFKSFLKEAKRTNPKKSGDGLWLLKALERLTRDYFVKKHYRQLHQAEEVDNSWIKRPGFRKRRQHK